MNFGASPIDASVDNFILSRYNRAFAGALGLFTPRGVHPHTFAHKHTHRSGNQMAHKCRQVLSRAHLVSFQEPDELCHVAC